MPVENPPKKPMRREIELDFIRGVAILLVLDFHSPHTVLLYPFFLLGYPNFGWAGVDIFFVLSGFLVGGLLVKEGMLAGTIDGRRFLIRRGFKIWPQYYLFLCLMLVTGHRTFRQLRGNFLNIQNYTGGVAHTWTLAVEEHAYLILAAGLMLAIWAKVRLRYVLLGLATAIVSVIWWSLYLTARGVDTFERTDTRIDGIFYGVMLAIIYHRLPDIFGAMQRQRVLWFAILVSGLIYLRFIPRTFWGFPLSWDFANLMGVALLMLLYKHRAGPRPALYRLVAWIGFYSYGIYLWHISVVSSVLSIDRYLPRRTVFFWEIVAVPVAGILAGVLTTKLVETPALRLRDYLYPRRVDSAVGVPAETEVLSEGLASTQT